MAPPNTVKVLELGRVAPPPDSVTQTSLPLTFFDLIWLRFPPNQRLFFYDYPHSKTHFKHSLIPKLKSSLSLVLQHFYPLAGSLTWPLESEKPVIQYNDGDSVSLTIAESDNNFYHLTSNHARDVNESHPLLPNLPTSDTVAAILALQVTVFPNSGFCIGMVMHHAVSDGQTATMFRKSWSSICRSGDSSLLPEFLPIYDRAPLDKVKGTFELSRSDIERLRKWVLTRREKDKQTLPLHATTFVLTCAYVWVCLVRAEEIRNEKVSLIFAIDCRARLDPPIPTMYFGNCVTCRKVTAETCEIMGEDGVAVAVEAFSEAIRGLDNQVLGEMEEMLSVTHPTELEWLMGIAGSTRFGVYETDFGWGRPTKVETPSIDITGSISLAESRDGSGGVQVGLALNKLKMECKTQDCPWNIHASIMQDGQTFKVKKLNDDHAGCIGVNDKGNHMASAEWIANEIQGHLQNDPDYTVGKIQNELHNKYNLTLNYHHVWRGRENALKKIHGSHEDAYALIPNFCSTLLVDGCHLKNMYKGVLLSATALDGNNGLFPLAIAVVKSECELNWIWFFERLQMCIPRMQTLFLTIMSDRQKGLLNAVKQGKALESMFWAATRAYTRFHFQTANEEIKKLSTTAYTWVDKCSSKSWSRAFFDKRVCMITITNNMSESFNNFISSERYLPLLELVNGIRVKLIKTMTSRCNQASTWVGVMVPKVEKYLVKLKKEARACSKLVIGNDEYKVKCHERGTFVATYSVFLQQRTCSCQFWQVSGLPSVHAIKAVEWKRLNVDEVCDYYYTVEAYKCTYSEVIHSLPDRRFWNVVNVTCVLPPRTVALLVDRRRRE
ncbi:hypothetical protein HHK36_024446 [Tetracentron sinense]|uniref:SWIM-type domain-containing protein n=1 Tax=Tetracentron sinense TaxID=13715 RepID=A0A835D6Q1_TETSI|nr:hypothetical protein HHK36_024446 [Tetracentron sinense]